MLSSFNKLFKSNPVISVLVNKERKRGKEREEGKKEKGQIEA